MATTCVVAFDVSARRIGGAVVDYTSGKITHASVMHTNTGDDLNARYDQFATFAATLDYFPIGVFIEDGFLMRHTGMVATLCAIGNIEAWSHTQWPGTLVTRIKPATWRKTLGLQSRGKDDPLFYARENFHTDTGKHLANHLNVKSTRSKTSGEQDAADAICIAKAGRELLWRGGVE